MTRKEADEEAKRINEESKPSWFCPMINDICRKDCVNFMPAFSESTDRASNGKRKSVTLHKVDDDAFTVEGFVCTNAMFIGDAFPMCGGV